LLRASTSAATCSAHMSMGSRPVRTTATTCMDAPSTCCTYRCISGVSSRDAVCRARDEECVPRVRAPVTPSLPDLHGHARCLWARAPESPQSQIPAITGTAVGAAVAWIGCPPASSGRTQDGCPVQSGRERAGSPRTRGMRLCRRVCVLGLPAWLYSLLSKYLE